MRFRGPGTIWDLVTPWRVVGALTLMGIAALILFLGQILWHQPGGTLLTVVGVVSYFAS